MAADLRVSLTLAADPPWTRLPAIPLGRLPAGAGTPVLYGLVERAGRPVARLDVYGEPGSETYFAAEALAWADRVVVGFGGAAYIVSPGTGEVATLPLPCYFQAFRPAGASLLVVFGTGITRLDPPGVVAWQNDSLAVDGIEIDGVAEGRVQGRGEWDPPGGWRPFTVSLATGRTEDAPPLVT